MNRFLTPLLALGAAAALALSAPAAAPPALEQPGDDMQDVVLLTEGQPVLARVHAMDPQLIERTRRWLLGHRRSDGFWSAGRGSIQGMNVGDYGLTAYVAWAVYHGQAPGPEARPTLDYLLAQKPEAVGDPYVLALVCNALQALDPEGSSAAAYLQRLEELKVTLDDGKRVRYSKRTGNAVE